MVPNSGNQVVPISGNRVGPITGNSALLEESTGQRLPVRGVVLFPGWFVEPMTRAWKEAGLPWVLTPKALSAFIQNEPQRLEEGEVTMAASHLDRYIHSELERRAKRA